MPLAKRRYVNAHTFRNTDPRCREHHRSSVDSQLEGPVTQRFDGSFDFSMDKLVNKQSIGWWIETLLLSPDVTVTEQYPVENEQGNAVDRMNNSDAICGLPRG